MTRARKHVDELAVARSIARLRRLVEDHPHLLEPDALRRLADAIHEEEIEHEAQHEAEADTEATEDQHEDRLRAESQREAQGETGPEAEDNGDTIDRR